MICSMFHDISPLYKTIGAKFLIERGADVNYEDVHGQTPLLTAAEKGYFDIIEILIKHKANYCETVLDIAIRNGHLKAVKFLIDKGANVNARTVNGETASTIAWRNGQLKIVEALRDADSVIANADCCLKILKDATGICCVV